MTSTFTLYFKNVSQIPIKIPNICLHGPNWPYKHLIYWNSTYIYKRIESLFLVEKKRELNLWYGHLDILSVVYMVISFCLTKKKKKRQRKNEKTFSTLIALSVALFTGLIASFRHFMRGIQGGLSLVHQHAIGFFFYLI